MFFVSQKEKEEEEEEELTTSIKDRSNDIEASNSEISLHYSLLHKEGETFNSIVSNSNYKTSQEKGPGLRFGEKLGISLNLETTTQNLTHKAEETVNSIVLNSNCKSPQDKGPGLRFGEKLGISLNLGTPAQNEDIVGG